jgi:uncharacterized protein YjbI with pentapeptide repeats
MVLVNETKANLMQTNFESVDLLGGDLRSANLNQAANFCANTQCTKFVLALDDGSRLAK